MILIKPFESSIIYFDFFLLLVLKTKELQIALELHMT